MQKEKTLEMTRTSKQTHEGLKLKIKRNETSNLTQLLKIQSKTNSNRTPK